MDFPAVTVREPPVTLMLSSKLREAWASGFVAITWAP